MAVRVKIRKDAVIEALNTRLALNEKAQKEQEAVDKEYDKAVTKYVSDVLALVKKGAVSAKNANHRPWSKAIEVTFTYQEATQLPSEPEKGPRAEGVLVPYEIEEIHKNIKLLGMCDDEYLSASLYKDVVKYL